MADFEAWDSATLVRFADEASQRIIEQLQYIAELEADRRFLLDELRRINRLEAP